MSKLNLTNSLGPGKFQDLVKLSTLHEEVSGHKMKGPIQATTASPLKDLRNLADSAAEYHSYRPTIHATTHSLAGASGALIAMALIYPLDNLRTRLQVSRRETNLGISAALEEILRVEGWKGLYAGLRSALIGVGTSWAVYYYFYALFKEYLAKKLGKESSKSSIANLGVAIASGIISAVATNPIWVVNTRMKLRQESNKGFFELLKQLSVEEGLSGLFSGLSPSLILVANPAIQFAVYEKLKSWLIFYKNSHKHSTYLRDPINSRLMFGDRNRTKGINSTNNLNNNNDANILHSTEILIIGAIAKLISTLATYPYQVIKSRLQVGKTNDITQSYGGSIDCVVKIIEQEGFKGLFKGVQSKLLATALTSAVMFASYERILSFLFAIQLKLGEKK